MVRVVLEEHFTATHIGLHRHGPTFAVVLIFCSHAVAEEIIHTMSDWYKYFSYHLKSKKMSPLNLFPSFTTPIGGGQGTIVTCSWPTTGILIKIRRVIIVELLSP